MRLASGLRVAMLMAICLLATGCAHRKVKAALPPMPTAPVDLATVAEPKGEIPKVSPPQTPVPTASSVPRDMRRLHRKPAAKPTVTPPVQVATVTPPVPVDPMVIGALTAGGDSAPHRQEASVMISENDKRVASIAPDLAKDKQPQIAQVKDFQKKAQSALDSGDVEGAITLATKARLLLDDLLKG